MIGLVGWALLIAITFLYFNELGWAILVGAWVIVLFLPLLTLLGITGWLARPSAQFWKRSASRRCARRARRRSTSSSRRIARGGPV